MSFINYLRVNDSEKKMFKMTLQSFCHRHFRRGPLCLCFGTELWTLERDIYKNSFDIIEKKIRKLFFNVIRLRWALWVINLELFYIPFVNTSILFRDSYIIQLVHKTMTGKYYMGRCDLILIHVFKIFVIVFSTCIFYQIQSKFSKRKM